MPNPNSKPTAAARAKARPRPHASAPEIDAGAGPQAALHELSVPIGELRPHPRNPRRGDLEAIKQSLRLNGQYRPIVVNHKSGEVLAGNHTLKAAQELGWERIAATFVDVDEHQAKRILLADNRTNDLAGYDDRALVELLEELPELEGTGYDRAALDELILELRGPALPGPDEEVPAVPAKPNTRPGDLYLLGPHRLLCADARERRSYQRLLAQVRPELLWTDPPYGISYTGKTKAKLTLKGDGAGVEALLQASFAHVDQALAAGAPLYLCHPAGPLSLVFGRCFLEAGWQLRQTLVWIKHAIVLGRSDYHYRHESILYGYKPGAGRRGRGHAGWYGGNAQSSVIELPRPRAAREHPTMKPPALVSVALRNSSRAGAAVLDPFAGSGSTLVACEALARRAFLLELDPRYCDVIVARYEKLTGGRARRERR